ncbi:hypothetical protein D3C76_1766470 [compost metagenome]
MGQQFIQKIQGQQMIILGKQIIGQNREGIQMRGPSHRLPGDGGFDQTVPFHGVQMPPHRHFRHTKPLGHLAD